VFFLSTGIMGLNFLGVDSFVQNLFYGGGLVIAVYSFPLVPLIPPRTFVEVEFTYNYCASVVLN